MINYINKHMYKEFMQLCKNAKYKIRLCAPFIKSNIIADLLENSNDNVKLELITNINLQYFHRKASDVEAVRNFIRAKGKVYNCTTLHAKVYIFDDTQCIITSANLTLSGLKKNLERGIISFDKCFIDKVINDYISMQRENVVGKITIKNIDEIDKLLQSIPVPQKINYPHFEVSQVFDGDIRIISNELKGWQAAVFNSLNNLQNDTFNSKTISMLAEQLYNLYPNNNNRIEKIRQILQQLRDKGLIEFTSPGNYRRLWKKNDYV